MSSSSRPISWNLQRGCCTVKELSQFKPFLSKTSSLDGFHTLSLGLLFWQLSLPRDPHFASFTVCNTGPTFQGPVGHLSLPWCMAAGPECVFSSHHFSSEILASVSCGSLKWECGDNLFGTGSAVCVGIQCSAEGGNDCDSNTTGLKNRKEGEDARLGDRGLGAWRGGKKDC